MKRINFTFLKWGTVNPRQVAKKLLPPIVVDIVKWFLRSNKNASEEAIQRYLHNGRIPWSKGYSVYKKRLIIQALTDEALLDRFRRGAALPPDYGFGVDERCVEYPWLMAHLHDEMEVLLDAGSTLNFDFVLEHPTFQRKNLHILTLAPEPNCFWCKGVSYLYDDLRDIPIRDNYYDTIACISTLEHVGMDNTRSARSELHAEQRTDDFLKAVLEMRRVLKPGGRLFITVPYGRYRNFGIFQQFDAQLVKRTIATFEPEWVEQTYFHYTSDGWNISTAKACADAECVDWIALPRPQRQATLPEHPDRAAAARGVACLLLSKPR